MTRNARSMLFFTCLHTRAKLSYAQYKMLTLIRVYNRPRCPQSRAENSILMTVRVATPRSQITTRAKWPRLPSQMQHRMQELVFRPYATSILHTGQRVAFISTTIMRRDSIMQRVARQTVPHTVFAHVSLERNVVTVIA